MADELSRGSPPAPAPVHDDTEMIRRSRLGRRAEAAARLAALTPASTPAALVRMPTPTPTPEPEPEPEPIWALALSGGGIRSATLSLGVLQAIAATPVAPAAPSAAPSPRQAGQAGPAGTPQGAAAPRAPRPDGFRSSLLSRFGYLSTVSGGGYIGAFLVSLFVPGRLRDDGGDDAAAAADDAVKVLCSEPPGRLHADATFTQETVVGAPLAWLRDNGRYLAPSGGGDMFYAVSLALRNWVAVHYVLGTVLMTVFAFTAFGSAWIDAFTVSDRAQLQHALLGLSGQQPGWTDGWWWSPLLWPAAVLLAAWPLPAGLAFWLPQPAGADGRNRIFNGAFWGLIVAIVGLFWAASHAPSWSPGAGLSPVPDRFLSCASAPSGDSCFALGDALRAEPIWIGWAIAFLGLLHYLAASLRSDDIDLLRVRLTRSLTYGLLAVGVLLGLAAVDSVAHTFYLALVTHEGRMAGALTPAGVAAGVVWLVRRFALTSDGKQRPAWMSSVPWTWLGGIAGMAIMAVIAVAWALLVILLQWQGHRPDPQLLGPPQQPLILLIFAVTLGLTVIAGCFPSFINLSSLQSFYSARLTRAYLGASNGARFLRPPTSGLARDGRNNAQPSSVAQPDNKDAVRLGDFLGVDPLGSTTLRTLAPLHLINVTINATVDPAEQLVQRDRKGLPLVVTPRGFTIDGGELRHFVDATPNIELQRTLSLGQWIGTSGAAFSTGIGRETSLGLSMLMGAANVRLGTWWQSGAGDSRNSGWLSRALEFAFRTQSYLFGEFTAQFHGMNRRWQYLSDGGHFENTAVYDLLRPEREVRFILACDHGADPDYRFDDLANLIRLARIDLGLELRVEADVARDPALRPWFGVPADFRSPLGAMLDAVEGRPAKMPAAPDDAVPAHEPVALLLRACRGWPALTTCWIVLLKPRVRTDSAADVVQYALANPAFPQQPTADQFFDEAQWESYRKLGHDNASHLLDTEVWGALQAYIARGGPPVEDVPMARKPVTTSGAASVAGFETPAAIVPRRRVKRPPHRP